MPIDNLVEADSLDDEFDEVVQNYFAMQQQGNQHNSYNKEEANIDPYLYDGRLLKLSESLL